MEALFSLQPSCLLSSLKLCSCLASIFPQYFFLPFFFLFACIHFTFAMIFEIGKSKLVLTHHHGSCLCSGQSPLQCLLCYCYFVRCLKGPSLPFFEQILFKSAVFVSPPLSSWPAGLWLCCLSEWVEDQVDRKSH